MLKRLALAFLVSLTLGATHVRAESLELLNVSYDPTRELYRAINTAFTAEVQSRHRHRSHHPPVARRLGHAGPCGRSTASKPTS